jgi:hypothetical protein
LILREGKSIAARGNSDQIVTGLLRHSGKGGALSLTKQSAPRGQKTFLKNKRVQALGHEARGNLNRRKVMLWTIFVILLVLWLLGLVSSYTLGGFIHILLVLAIVVLIINLVSGRRGV